MIDKIASFVRKDKAAANHGTAEGPAKAPTWYEVWALRPELIVENGVPRLGWNLFHWKESAVGPTRLTWGPFNSEQDGRKAYELLQVKCVVLCELNGAEAISVTNL